jgi:hypothetical protein
MIYVVRNYWRRQSDMTGRQFVRIEPSSPSYALSTLCESVLHVVGRVNWFGDEVWTNFYLLGVYFFGDVDRFSERGGDVGEHQHDGIRSSASEKIRTTLKN